MKNKTKYLYAVGVMLLFAIVVNGMAYIVSRPTTIKEEYVSYKNTMKQSDAESVLAVIQAENFDEAFNHYSTYRDISDMRFHQLRKSYLDARQELMQYVSEAAHTKAEVPYYLRSYKNEGRN